ncbi:MAG: 16S rRNA (cytosine(1402)-N(4))-methyltransferase RsmH [Planctomycetota bacterium]
MSRSKRKGRRRRPQGRRDPHRPWGRTRPGTHVPVLCREVLGCLEPAAGEVVVDATLGYGGHAEQLARRIGPTGRLIGLDVDRTQLARTRERLEAKGVTLSTHHANFSQIREVLDADRLDGADVIFADLGVSSMQLDAPERGMGYKHPDAPLDMRMDPTATRTAADVLATIDEAALSAALRDLADEDDHAKIAAWIVRQREVTPLTRVGQLVRLVMDAKGLTKRTWRDDPATRYGRLHPAARTFQALRILVNDELAHLRALLAAVPACLRPGGRVGIISFHSGEDRLVKRAFRDGCEQGVYARCSAKPLTPRPSEVRTNPRSASAKFRWAAVPGRAEP